MDNSKKLLELLVGAFREDKYTRERAQQYLNWVKLFLHHYHNRATHELSADSVKEYLRYLADEKGLMPSKQKQAYEAISFFYTRVLKRSMWSNIDLGEVTGLAVTTAQQQAVFEKDDNDSDLVPDWTNQLLEPFRSISRLKYECGLKFAEVLNIRLEDVDLDDSVLHVRDAFGELTAIQVSTKTLKALTLQKKRALNSLRQDERSGNVFFSNPNPLNRNSFTNQSRWYPLFPGSLQYNMHIQKKLRLPLQLDAVTQAMDEAKTASRQLEEPFAAETNRVNRQVKWP